MKKALIPAFLLVLGSTVLGATVLKEQLAWAAPPLPSVFVANDAASPVPAREQNVDPNGNIKVHEQGTADVNVTNTSLSVVPPPPVTGGGGGLTMIGCPHEHVFQGTRIASALRITWSSTIFEVTLRRGDSVVASFVGPSGPGGAESPVDLALARPVAFDRWNCVGTGEASVSWVGNEP